MKKLLVVVDMQNDFVSGVLGTKEAQSIVEKVAKYVDTFDGDVAFTRDTHYANYLDTQEGQNLPVKHCIKDTEGWKIVPEIKVTDSDFVFNKTTFGSTDLAVFARTGKYTEIEFVGVCTDICVISNVLIMKASMPESKIIVHKDLCAGVTPESHETALKAMAACQVTIV